MQPKYEEKANLFYMDTGSFIVYITIGDTNADIAKDVEAKFDTSNYELNRPLPKGKNKKIIGLMEDELDGEIMKEFVALKVKTYNYLKDNNDEDKKAKGTEKSVIKRKLKFKDYKKCLKQLNLKMI